MKNNGTHFDAKEELIRVIFAPINSNLRKEVGKSLIEVHEDGNLFIAFITCQGSIRLKLSEKRLVIYEWGVSVSDELTHYILKRFCLFLRRNDVGVLRILLSKDMEALTEYVRKNYQDVIFESMGEKSYLELRVLEFLKTEIQRRNPPT